MNHPRSDVPDPDDLPLSPAGSAIGSGDENGGPGGSRAPRAPGDAGEGAPEGGAAPGGTLSHVDPDGGHSCMVDVGAKPVTARAAEARAFVRFPNGILPLVLEGRGPKGAIEEVARAAGILAAKRTGELIPMCHPLGLDHLQIRFSAAGDDRLEIRCRATCTGRTGVEMEAMVGASVAALTVYDMTKALDHGIVLESVSLLEKSGGKSGTWRAPHV